MRHGITLIFIALVGAVPLRGAGGALAALERGDYEEAVALLEEEVATQPSAAAYYNLGLAQLKSGSIGQATWAALSSRALGGVDGTEALIERLTDQTPSDLRPLAPAPQAIVWRRLATSARDDLWAALAILLSLVGGLFACGALVRRGRLGGVGALTGATCWALALGMASLAYTRARLRHSAEASVVAATSMYAAPSTMSEAVRGLPAGVALTLGERLDDHFSVTLPTGEAGWVPSESVRRVLR